MEHLAHERSRDTGEPEPVATDRPAPAAEPVTAPVADKPDGDSRAWARKGRLRSLLLIGGLVLLLLVGAYFYLTGGRYESTDNAQLQAAQIAIAANVSGPVIAVAVGENQSVKAGQILFRIDPRPFETAVAEAEAQLADAGADIQSKRADYREGVAQTQAAQAQLTFALAEAARQKQLLADGISSKSQYDQAVLQVATARQAIATNAQKAESVRATLSGTVDAPSAAQPAVRAAQAALERARLNLSYTIVRAPQDGIVTRVNQLPVGSYVTAARPVFSLVGQNVWVVANFKESQLGHMRVGQRATVKVDAFPDVEMPARLTSFSPGTGNSFSLLPPENATGNWVKVVQRLPVQFAIDRVPAGLPLHAGLSAEVTVDSGHVRHLFGPDTIAR